MSQGMFPGAVVVRGADWRWGDQDGQSFHSTLSHTLSLYTWVAVLFDLMGVTLPSTCISSIHVHLSDGL